MFEAQFVSGEPLMTDHTPGSALAAGTVVVVGNTPRVAHVDIPANTLGALAARGGVYRATAQSGSDIAAGALVYWDNTNNVMSTSATGNLVFGHSVAAVTKATVGEFVHDPNAAPAA
jgi:predicted RecA/RadA family phage recombinase